MGSSAAAIMQGAQGIVQGIGLYQEGRAADKQSKVDAELYQSAARVEAKKIREAAANQKSSAIAQAAENGLDVSTGTPVVVNDYITQQSEQDAWMTILNGREAASVTRQQGKAARRAGTWGFVSSATGGLLAAKQTLDTVKSQKRQTALSKG